MFRRLINLPFAVAGKAARAFQEREDARTREKFKTEHDPGAIENRHSAALTETTLDPSTVTMDVTAVRALLGQNTPVAFVDVRAESAWKAGHIPGAMSMPMATVNIRVSELPTDQMVIAFCENGAESLQAVTFFRERGMEDTWVLAGGMAAWRAAGGPTEKG